jgi:hypothetical protein
VLITPPAGVDYGIQRGSGAQYETLFVQRPKRGDVTFDFSIGVAETINAGPDFRGPFVQGPRDGRFIYIDVGTYAGQKNTPWSRKMKIPLQDITSTLIRRVLKKPDARLAAKIPGTARDGGPNCATVELLGDWEVR